MLNILPRGVGREISNSLSRLCNGSKWGGPDIVVVQPHTVAERKEDKIAWQLLGEALIDGSAPGGVSLWTWLTGIHMKHSSLAAMVEWDTQCKLGSILFRKAPEQNLHRSSNDLFADILRIALKNLEHSLKLKNLEL